MEDSIKVVVIADQTGPLGPVGCAFQRVRVRSINGT
jgi:hypothetical protein